MAGFARLLLVLLVAGGLGVGGAIVLLGRGPEPALAPPSVPAGTDPGVLGVAPGYQQFPRPGELGTKEYWAARNNAALHRLDAGEFAEAVAELELCFAAQPSDPAIHSNLVEALARFARGLWEQGDRKQALWKLERAVELSADLTGEAARDDLPPLLDRWRRQEGVEEDYWEDVSQHFNLSYDARHRDLLEGYHQVIERLETAYGDLYTFFVFDPVFERGGRRYDVTLYRREEFTTVTGLDSWAGGAFDGTIRVPVADLAAELPHLEPRLRHELVHAFIDQLGGRSVPGWLNEGLAQWLTADRAPALASAPARLAEGTFTLAELAGSYARWTDEEAVARAYAQSVVVIDRMVATFGERFVADLVPTEDPLAAFRERTGLDPEAWAAEQLALVLDGRD